MQLYLVTINAVLEEEISDVHVSSPLATRGAAILPEKDCAFIILKDHIILDVDPLGFEEVPGP